MNCTDSIFQVIKSNDEDSIGTACAISTKGISSDIYYFITAYHVISELVARNMPILLRSNIGEIYNAFLEYPDSLSSIYRIFSNDFCLLSVKTNDFIETLPLGIASKPKEVIVRGAIKNYDTKFTSFPGKIFWEEKLKYYDKPVLQINLETKIIFDESKVISQQKVLMGLSGAPILVETNNCFYCVGVINNIADSSASIAYGTPIAYIIEDCLNRKNLISDITDLDNNINPNIVKADILIDTLFDDQQYSFENCNSEVKIWDRLSGLFYKGVKVDYLLEVIISTNKLSNMNYDVLLFMEYFYSRLLFKKGMIKEPMRIISNIYKNYNKINLNTKFRLDALIQSRLAIENSSLTRSAEIIDNLFRCSGRFVELKYVNDKYISNEQASLYGRGLTNFFNHKLEISSNDKRNMISLLDKHTSLLNSYPKFLRKQSVVNTSLNWFFILWEINQNGINTDELLNYSLKGFEQSKQNSNSIFYIQSMIVLAIYYWIRGKNKNSTYIFFLVGRLMKAFNIKITHEGITQLLFFLKENYPICYALLIFAYDYINQKLFFDKISLFDLKLTNNEIIDTINKSESFYEIEYNNITALYNKDYNKLLIL